MGYTHYYRQTRDMTDAEFEGFRQDVEKLRDELPATAGDFHERYGETAGGYGASSSQPLRVEPQGLGAPGPSVAGVDAVGFNGAGFGDADHETFWIPKSIMLGAAAWEVNDIKAGERFHCTKTARKPYDAMVCACLLALKRRAPDAWKVSSDGSVEEWVGAYRFARHVLGEGIRLEDIGGFERDRGALEDAETPTPWLAAQQERAALGKVSAQATARPARTPGL